MAGPARGRSSSASTACCGYSHSLLDFRQSSQAGSSRVHLRFPFLQFAQACRAVPAAEACLQPNMVLVRSGSARELIRSEDEYFARQGRQFEAGMLRDTMRYGPETAYGAAMWQGSSPSSVLADCGQTHSNMVGPVMSARPAAISGCFSHLNLLISRPQSLLRSFLSILRVKFK